MAAPAAIPDRQLQVDPEGLGFLVDHYSLDIGPLKYIRELTKNGLEALQQQLAIYNGTARDYKPQFRMVEDPYWKTKFGVSKAAFADNGVGMYRQEMLDFYGYLYKSGKRQAHDGNQGHGSRISLLPFNQYGVEIRSWRGGKGHRIVLAPGKTGGYVMKALEQYDEEGSLIRHLDNDDNYIVPIDLENEEDASMKPPFIGDHGTVVIPLGNRLEQNTVKAPEGHGEIEGGDKSYAGFAMNRAFYNIPAELSVSVLSTSMVYGKEETQSRRVHGYKSLVEGNTKLGGVKELRDVYVHWHVLADSDEERKAFAQRHFVMYPGLASTSFATVAFVFNDELRDFRIRREAGGMLREFGIVEGRGSVMLFVFPKAHFKVTDNITRTSVTIEKETQQKLYGVFEESRRLPWSDWAEEFRDDMPMELIEWMDKQVRGDRDVDEIANDFINKNLEELVSDRTLMQAEKAATKMKVVDDVTEGAQQSKEINERDEDGWERGEGKPVTDKPNPNPTTFRFDGPFKLQRKLGSRKADEDDVPTEREVRDFIAVHKPKVMWVPEDDFVQDDPDLRGKAAQYDKPTNASPGGTLTINENCPVIQYLKTKCFANVKEPYRSEATMRKVRNIVEGIYEAHLLLTVLKVKRLKIQESSWQNIRIEDLLRADALTAAVSNTVYLTKILHATLGGALKSAYERKAWEPDSGAVA